MGKEGDNEGTWRIAVGNVDMRKMNHVAIKVSSDNEEKRKMNDDDVAERSMSGIVVHDDNYGRNESGHGEVERKDGHVAAL